MKKELVQYKKRFNKVASLRKELLNDMRMYIYNEVVNNGKVEVNPYTPHWLNDVTPLYFGFKNDVRVRKSCINKPWISNVKEADDSDHVYCTTIVLYTKPRRVYLTDTTLDSIDDIMCHKLELLMDAFTNMK